jgi:hypothetical protein
VKYTSLLDEALEGWHGTRKGLLAEVENLTQEQLEFRPAAGARNAIELVQHVIEVGLIMGGELTRPDGDFHRLNWQGFLREYAGHINGVAEKQALIGLLRSSHAESDHKFREVGELFMLQYIRRFDGQFGSRLAWLWSGSGHEYYHRGQVAMLARMQGVEPALTQRIRKAAAPAVPD